MGGGGENEERVPHSVPVVIWNGTLFISRSLSLCFVISIFLGLSLSLSRYFVSVLFLSLLSPSHLSSLPSLSSISSFLYLLLLLFPSSYPVSYRFPFSHAMTQKIKANCLTFSQQKKSSTKTLIAEKEDNFVIIFFFFS